jgi:hypothetical protein
MNGALQLNQFLLLSWLVKSVDLAMWTAARTLAKKKHVLCVMSSSNVLRYQMWRKDRPSKGRVG